MISANARRAPSASAMPSRTPPASVLCWMSGESIFMTTGKPIFSAANTASSADAASASFGPSRPCAAKKVLASASLNAPEPDRSVVHFGSAPAAACSTWVGAAAARSALTASSVARVPERTGAPAAAACTLAWWPAEMLLMNTVGNGALAANAPTAPAMPRYSSEVGPSSPAGASCAAMIAPMEGSPAMASRTRV